MNIIHKCCMSMDAVPVGEGKDTRSPWLRVSRWKCNYSAMVVYMKYL